MNPSPRSSERTWFVSNAVNKFLENAEGLNSPIVNGVRSISEKLMFEIGYGVSSVVTNFVKGICFKNKDVIDIFSKEIDNKIDRYKERK